MRVAVASICYNEARFIEPFLKHIPDWIEEKLVLVSTEPWFGEPEPDDGTADLARLHEATVIEHDWASETDQRNAGQEYLYDFDWVIWLDPDEFLDDWAWDKLNYLITHGSLKNSGDAYVVARQLTYWKDGYVADPPRDYQQMILCRPSVKFVDKRVVGCPYGVLPVELHHFSWARTDKEVWSKITHYAHAFDFDTKRWYNDVWLKWKPGMRDVHPTTPETLHELIPAKLPKELKDLKLWPLENK